MRSCAAALRAGRDEEEVGAPGGAPPTLGPLTIPTGTAPALRHPTRLCPPRGHTLHPWSRTGTQTLAEKIGGADDQGADAVGLTGTIPVEFTHGNDTLKTMAYVGQPLSAVRASSRATRQRAPP